MGYEEECQRIFIQDLMLRTIIHTWNVVLFYTIGMILMTLYPETIVHRCNRKAQTYTRKSKTLTGPFQAYHQRSKTVTRVIEAWRNILRRTKTRVTQILCKMATYIRTNCQRNKTLSRTWMRCMEIISMEVRTNNLKGARSMRFDTDSTRIGIDNRCSGCISHRVEDFEGPLTDTDKTIRGFGGSRISNIKMGTIRWRWLDDSGAVHQFRIPRSFYIPSGNVRLLSPQHWAKAIGRTSREKANSAGEITTGDKTTLFWEDHRYKLTVPMCPKTNVATFQTAPGYKGYHLFCQQAEMDDSQDGHPIIAQPGIDDNHDMENEDGVDVDRMWLSKQRMNQSEINLTGRHHIDNTGDEVDAKRENLVAEFLNIHYRSGHLGFQKLKMMARQGIIPNKFANAPIPVCTACMYGKATKKRWRDKPTKMPKELSVKQPGDKVSVDQMVSPTPGLIAQMTGILTTKRYRYATIYVDQASKLGFTYLQKTASAEETLQSKRAFEAFATNRGVKIRSYHADNGIFKANDWMDDCRRMRQPMTFAGVAAHHQNGYAERRIRTLQEMARTMLAHGNKRWKVGITTQLWPYALRMANAMINESPNMQDSRRRSPEQIFTGSEVQANSKHWHTFGCPVYVLSSDLQTGKPFHMEGAVENRDLLREITPPREECCLGSGSGIRTRKSSVSRGL